MIKKMLDSRIFRNAFNAAVLVASLFACACSSLQEEHNIFATCKLDGSKIVVDVDTFSTYKYYLSLGPLTVDSGVVKGHKDLFIPSIIKGAGQFRKEIALNAAKRGCMHEITLRVNDAIDTTFAYRQTITEIPDEKISFKGFGAPLIRKSKKENVDNELRVWLYRKQEHIDDSLFTIFRSIYSELSLTGDNEYIPVGRIPVAHDIEGRRMYKINGDVQADYYAVVACQDQAYINQFIEQLVGNNFAGVSTSLASPLACHYKKGTSGYRNVFLLCINKDWTYKQIPIATFALDNSAPESSFYCALSSRGRNSQYDLSETLLVEPEPESLSYNNRIKVLYPNDRPKIFGGAIVSVTNFDGNGLECNVTFRVELSGDSKSATIQRRGELCYPSHYSGNLFKPEDKVIYAKDHNGVYIFMYKMHFDDGDNIIPVIVEDYNGNKYRGSITVKAKFVRSNAPSINIDNNIDIYNH